jgi:hypothetical protein
MQGSSLVAKGKMPKHFCSGNITGICSFVDWVMSINVVVWNAKVPSLHCAYFGVCRVGTGQS